MIAWMTLRLRKRAIMRRREARAVKKMSDYIDLLFTLFLIVLILFDIINGSRLSKYLHIEN